MQATHRITRWIGWMVRGLGVIGVLGLLAGIAFYVWFSRTILADLPEDLSHYRDWVPLTNVVVTDSDGTEVDRFYVERRRWVDIETLPDHVWQAFVAAEDRRFFSHPGIDVFGIARAVVGNTLAGSTRSGASTLTQQLVKNLLVGNERSYERKLKEAVLAYRLERDVGKERILELYINYVALGSGNYGIDAASRDYFGIPAAELDVGQAALIAGLVPAPSRYSPRRWPEVAKQRRRLVLGRMVRADYLSIDAAEAHYDDPIIVPEREEPVSEANAAYLTEVRRTIRRTFGTEAPFQAGFNVRTPLRQDVQKATLQAVQDATDAHLERQGPIGVRSRGIDLPRDSDRPCFLGRIESLSRPATVATLGGRFALLDVRTPVHGPQGKRPLSAVARVGDGIRVCRREGGVALAEEPWAQAAAVVVHWPTGEVVAAVGGRNVPLEGFDRVTQARRQPGSSFKPYVYAAALEDGMTQMTTVTDSPLTLGSWSPKNYGGGYAGSMPMRSAMARSLNTVAVRLLLQSGGGERVAGLARDLGVRTPLRDDPTIALGSSEVTPLDQAMGYAGLLRGGVPTEPVWVRRVDTVDGGPSASAGEMLRLGEDTVKVPGGPGARVLRPETAYQVVDMLREVVRAGTARRAHDPKRDRGGKTGTTNDFVDAWIVGFTRNHVIAVWVGTDGVGSLGDKETGGRAALPAWLAIADALDEPADDRIPAPPQIGWTRGPSGPVALPWASQAR